MRLTLLSFKLSSTKSSQLADLCLANNSHNNPHNSSCHNQPQSSSFHNTPLLCSQM